MRNDMYSKYTLEEILEGHFSLRYKVTKCLYWLKTGELSHIFVWGADSETAEGSQIRLWYNKAQDTFYGMLTSGEIRKCSAPHMVYQHIVKDTFDTYDEEGIHVVRATESTADRLYKHLYKGDLNND